MLANTRPARACGVPKTTTSTSWSAPARGAELADVDELLDARRHGLLTPEVAEQAVRRAVHAVDGLARNDYDLNAWLAGNGMRLIWRQ